MTIYATPFTHHDKQCTGASVDSGFESIEQVVAVMGEPVRESVTFVIYGEGNERVIYSKIIFRIDEGINKR